MNEIKTASWSQYEGIPDYVKVAHDNGVLDASGILESERGVNYGDYLPYDQFSMKSVERQLPEPLPYSLATSALARFGLVPTEARHAKPRSVEDSAPAVSIPELPPEPITVFN